MKTFVILFTLFYFLNALAVAPYGFKGQEQSQTLYSNVLQAPNNLVTNLGGINALMETGNNNLLVNPSFEHLTFSTGWTNSVGAFTEETALEIHGKKAAKLVLSSQTMSLTQSSTLYQAQFADGVQGLASVRVKSNVALKVCSVQAGVVSTSLCVDVQANNKWGIYKVPFILGATSNGISIASTGAVSGTVYTDDAFVGAVDLKQDINVVGPWTNYTPTGNFTNTTYTGKWRQVGEEVEVRIKGVLTGTPTSDIQVSIPSQFTIDTTKLASTVILSELGRGSANDLSTNSYYTFHIGYASNTLLYATYQGNTSGQVNAISPSLPFIWAAGDSFSITAKFPVTQFSNATSVYSSTNADTDWASCGHTPASFTGFGTVSVIETQCKRQGSDLLMKGKFTAGIPTSVEARVSLPLWNGVQLTSAGSSIIPSLQVAGPLTSSFFSSTYYSYMALIEPSVTYMTTGIQISTTSSINKTTGAGLVTTGNSVSFNARIPIEGWQQSNIIIGQFNGLESCSSTLDCTDTFSATITSTGTVTTGSENVDWLNGNCTLTSTGIYDCPVKTGVFSTKPNCVGSRDATVSAVFSSWSPAYDTTVSTSSNLRFGFGDQAGAKFNSPFIITCQKQGVDYIGKTAKAVASDQNMATPGVLKSVFYSAFTSGAGVISSEKGDFLNTCSCTTGTFTCSFNSNKFSTAPNCLIGNADIRDRYSHSISTTTSSLTWRLQDGTGNNYCLQQTILCHGEAP